jgi:hypothetical protein
MAQARYRATPVALAQIAEATQQNLAGPRDSGGRRNASQRYLGLVTSCMVLFSVGAENYYQHAEPYFRLMSSNREAT